MRLKFVLLLAVVLFGMLFALKVYGAITAPDTYCQKSHTTSSFPPKNLKTAQDFFDLGNYDFDSGDCVQAVVAYTQSISLDSTRATTFNNRAYANMRLHNYSAALSDLNTAITLNPTYVTALMNRGDIYNYYYARDRQKAISDYNTVIALGKEKDKSGSVCGHKAMAETNGLIPLAILKVITHADCK